MSRGRPRDPSIRVAILKAALDAVRTDGYAALTMDGLAEKAGVGKQTIYRWWSAKADVVLDAVLDDAATFVSPEPTADARHDVRRFLLATFKRLKTTGPVVRGLMAQAQLDPTFRTAFRDMFLAHRRAALRALLLRFTEPRDVDVRVDCLYGAMWYRLLDEHAPLDQRFVDDLLRIVCA